ncbi:MAG: DUF3997 domain-containing protein [Bacteroidota bacterium]
MRLKKLYFLPLVLTLTSCTFFSDSYYTVDLGNGYLFVSENKANQCIIHELDIGHYIIPPNVKDYAFDNAYIIGRQRDVSKRSDQDLGKNGKQYWIVSKIRGTIYGPLDSINFVRKQQELSIRLSMTSN